METRREDVNSWDMNLNLFGYQKTFWYFIKHFQVMASKKNQASTRRAGSDKSVFVFMAEKLLPGE